MWVHLGVFWLPHGFQIFRIQVWWRLDIVRHIWMLSRSCDEIFRVPLLGVFRWIEKGLGPAPMEYLLKIMWGWKATIPHCWYLPEGHIIIGLGRWGLQPEGYEWWLWYAVAFTRLCFTMLYCLPLCMQW